MAALVLPERAVAFALGKAQYELLIEAPQADLVSRPSSARIRPAVNADTGKNLKAGAMVRCAECGKLGEGSMEGWQAMLSIDIDDENTPTETHLFCPACAEREFGPPRADHEEFSP
jgi:hypothetical protein